MTLLIIEHNVQDFNEWKAAYDEHANVRNQFHLTNDRVFQGADDPHNVCVMCEGEPSDLQAFIAAPELKQAMQEAGVVGEPNIQIVESSIPAA